MKAYRLIILLVALSFGFNANAQWPQKDTLIKYIDKYIRNSAVQAFTNNRLNTALKGIINLPDSSGPSFDSSYVYAALADSMQVVRDSLDVIRESDISLSARIEDRLLKTALKDSLNGFAKTSDLTDKADLVDGKVPTSQIPALAITEFLGSVSSEEAMLELEGQPGDWCSRSDNDRNYMLIAAGGSDINDWRIIGMPSSPVESVNGQTGVIVLGKGDVGLGNVSNVDQTNASNLTSGTVDDARIPAIVVRNNANTSLGGIYTFSDPGGGEGRALEVKHPSNANKVSIGWRSLIFPNDGNSAIAFGTNGGIQTGTNGKLTLSLGNTGNPGRVYIPYGGIGIGVDVISAALQILKTTEQLRINYDASNYWNAITNSSGKTTFNAVGSDSSFLFNDSVIFAKGIAQAQVNGLADTLNKRLLGKDTVYINARLDSLEKYAVHIKALGTNRARSATSYAAVTDLDFPVVAGRKYEFRFFIAYNADATTTGSRWSVTGPTGGGTSVRYKVVWTLDEDNDTVKNGLTSFLLPSAANASSLATGNIAEIKGFLRAGESGTFGAQFASEVNGSNITALGSHSFVQYQEVP